MAPDDELVLLAQRGDTGAFEELVSRYDRRVLSIACSYSKNAEDAKDIYQEVFIRVYRALPRFRLDSKFSTWLHRIATNVCLTHRQQKKRHEHASLDEKVESSGQTMAENLAGNSRPDQDALNSEILSNVRQAMNRLSPQQRMVFTLRHFEGYKLKEIASMMNCAEGTVKKYLFTATERLREQLKDVL